MEFIGDGIANLPIEYRNGIDVMTTETTCLSSIWKTDEIVKNYYIEHGRPEDYKELNPAEIAMYDGVVEVDLGKIEPQIALPFHPSNVYNLKDVISNPKIYLLKSKLRVTNFYRQIKLNSIFWIRLLKTEKYKYNKVLSQVVRAVLMTIFLRQAALSTANT